MPSVRFSPVAKPRPYEIELVVESLDFILERYVHLRVVCSGTEEVQGKYLDEHSANRTLKQL
jgi:hypothetical protein